MSQQGHPQRPDSIQKSKYKTNKAVNDPINYSTFQGYLTLLNKEFNNELTHYFWEQDGNLRETVDFAITMIHDRFKPFDPRYDPTAMRTTEFWNKHGRSIQRTILGYVQNNKIPSTLMPKGGPQDGKLESNSQILDPTEKSNVRLDHDKTELLNSISDEKENPDLKKVVDDISNFKPDGKSKVGKSRKSKSQQPKDCKRLLKSITAKDQQKQVQEIQIGPSNVEQIRKEEEKPHEGIKQKPEQNPNQSGADQDHEDAKNNHPKPIINEAKNVTDKIGSSEEKVNRINEKSDGYHPPSNQNNDSNKFSDYQVQSVNCDLCSSHGLKTTSNNPQAKSESGIVPPPTFSSVKPSKVIILNPRDDIQPPAFSKVPDQKSGQQNQIELEERDNLNLDTVVEERVGESGQSHSDREVRKSSNQEVNGEEEVAQADGPQKQDEGQKIEEKGRNPIVDKENSKRQSQNQISIQLNKGAPPDINFRSGEIMKAYGKHLKDVPEIRVQSQPPQQNQILGQACQISATDQLIQKIKKGQANRKRLFNEAAKQWREIQDDIEKLNDHEDGIRLIQPNQFQTDHGVRITMEKSDLEQGIDNQDGIRNLIESNSFHNPDNQPDQPDQKPENEK